MKYKTILLLMVFTLFISACTGKPPMTSGQVASSEEGKICSYEKTTGTRIGARVCRTPQQVEIQKEAAQAAIKHLTRGKVSSGQ